MLYLTLDRLSIIQQLNGIDITPWNPQRGVTLALLILAGLRFFPVALLAPILSSQLLSAAPVPVAVALSGALVIASPYAAGAWVLRRWLGIDPYLSRPRDLVFLFVMSVVVSGIAALGFVGCYVEGGAIGAGDFGKAALQLWVGDAVGTVVFAPLVLVIAGHPPWRWSTHAAALRIEVIIQWASIGVALLLIFGDFSTDSYRLFYLIFLPLVWIASRWGLVGASWAVATIQAGLIAALVSADQSGEAIRSFQMLMFAVAATGLFLGATVSEQRRVALELAESQGRLAAILAAASDGVLTIGVDGRVNSANPAVERLFARPAEVLLGCDIHDLVEAPELIGRLAAAASSARLEPAPYEVQGRHSNGDTFPIELTAGRLGPPDSATYTLVVRDITSRREAEARVRQHQSELAQVSRESLAGEMSSALAHELNQPLTAIAAYAQGCLRLLRHAPAEAEELRESLEEVVHQAERAGDIIDRIRQFVSAGSYQRASLDVAPLVEAACALARVEADPLDITIEQRIVSDVPPISADRIQIEQVLSNLLRNAMDAVAGAPENLRTIVVEAKRAGDRSVEIAVADRGPGIAEEVAEHLFEPFVTTKPHGMGLGLAISRSIIESHDGRLRAKGRAGGGTIVAFELPVQAIG